MTAPSSLPRLVVARLSGGCGKTIVSLGLLLTAQRRGRLVRAFKKGPDYIDAAWLGWATGGPVHNIVGVILNQVSGRRHEQVLREAVEATCGIPVLGIIPRIPEASLLPERHLGLVVPAEYSRTKSLRATLEGLFEGRLDFEQLWRLSCQAPNLNPMARTDMDLPGGKGLTLKGHELHYLRILLGSNLPNTACAVRRGVGCYDGRDGVIMGNLWAGYTHLHALATPEWARGLLNAARRFANQKAEIRKQNVQPLPAF